MADEKSGERDFDVGPSAEELFGDLPSDSPVLDASANESANRSKTAIDRSRVAFDDVDDQTAADVFEQLRFEVGGPEGDDDILDESPEDIIARIDEPDEEPHLDDDLFDEAAFEDLLLTGRREEGGFLWVDTEDDAPNEAAGTAGDGGSPSATGISGNSRPSPASEAIANESLADVATKLSTMRREAVKRDERPQRTKADTSTRNDTDHGGETGTKPPAETDTKPPMDGNAVSSAETGTKPSSETGTKSPTQTGTKPSSETDTKPPTDGNAAPSAEVDEHAPAGSASSDASTGNATSEAPAPEPAADFSLASNADSQITDEDIGAEDVRDVIGGTSSVTYEDENANDSADDSSKSTGFFGRLFGWIF